MSYLEHFGLSSEPFSNAPVSRFYYSAPQHQQALQRLLYAVNSMKGLAVLVGQIGAGKSTLARRLLDSMPEEEYEAALLVIIHSGITASWLLRRIALQLGVENPAQEKLALLSQLYQRLLQIYEQGRKAVVLIDEAQMLETRELMEEFRGLLNLEVPERKLISFVFFGLPEIEKNLKLDPPLAQRVAMRYRLEPFSSESTDAYIKHRLRLAGSTHGLFTPGAVEAVHRRAGGTPRVINTLCDNALFESFLARAREIDAALIEQIADNLGLEYGAPSAPPAPAPVVAAPAAPAAPPEPPPIVAVPRGGGPRSPVEFGGAGASLTAALEEAGSAALAAAARAPAVSSALASPAAPQGDRASPEGTNVAPAVAGAAPVSGSLTPAVGSVAPVGGSLTPAVGSVAPVGGSLTPPVGSVAPVGGSLTPAVANVAPGAESGSLTRSGASAPGAGRVGGSAMPPGGERTSPVGGSAAPLSRSAAFARVAGLDVGPPRAAPTGDVAAARAAQSSAPAIASVAGARAPSAAGAGPESPGPLASPGAGPVSAASSASVPPAFPSPPAVAPATGAPSSLASLAAAARNFSSGTPAPAPPAGGAAPPGARPMVAGVPVNVLIRPGSPRPSAPTEPADASGANAEGEAASKPRTGVDLAEIDRYLEGLGKL